ncbi:MAG: PQQ-binding-like beta-propeller repeat protein [Chloroflexota bacterium]|nr:PQQ-binding-like beta-propeller repeat protein [Chloroflexota bacterium]MDE2969642.1 PQQ-binding-like beta-propeller repeat protein [Chloroflexota bacterium]
MTPGRWWVPILLVAMLALLSACGIDRFQARGWAGLTVEGDTLYVTSGEGRVFALNVAGDAEGAGGRPALIYNPFPPTNEDGLGPVYSTPVVGAPAGENGPGQESIYLVTYEDPQEDDDIGANVFALNAETGLQTWSTILPGRIVGAPSLAGNSLLIGTGDGSLHAIALPEDPAALPGRTWSPFQADGRIWSQAAVSDGSLYFGTLGHSVYAVNLADGKQRWRVELDGAVVGSPLVLNGTVYVGSLDRSLYALNAENGEALWSFEGDGWFWASPVHADGVIYAATLNGSLYALDAGGNRVWSIPAEASGPIVAAPEVLERSVVVATTENIVHQFSRIDGLEEWSIGVGEQVRAGMASNGDVVYLIDSEGVVHALHTAQRRELWTYPTRE